MPSEDELQRKMTENAERVDRGELSQAAMWILNERLQDQIIAQCNHSKTEKEDRGDEGYILWCANDNCGTMVANHLKKKSEAKAAGTVGKTRRKKKSGCVVVGIAFIGSVSAFVWWAVEAVNAVLVNT